MENSFKLPGGIADWLGDECFNKNRIENKLLDCFFSHGFKRVETPAFEYFKHFQSGTGAVLMTELFKFTDTDGHLLALRPDMTLPIARIAVTKSSSQFAGKYCYLANSYSLISGGKRDREFTQAGVELIGYADPKNKTADTASEDAQLIALAIDAITGVGLHDFLIDVGHVGFVTGIVGSLKLSESDETELIGLVGRKNIAGIEIFAKRENIADSVAIKILKKLPSLFGGAEVLVQAEKLVSELEKTDKNAFLKSMDAVTNLKNINELLSGFGVGEKVKFDMSNVNGAGYYTGMVFSGMTAFLGAPIVGGGRYDKLCKKDGEFLPGAGFAIGIKRLFESMKNAGVLVDEPFLDFVIGAEKGAEKQAFSVAKKLREQGNVVDNTSITDKNQLLAVRNEKSVLKAVFVKSDGSFEEF